MIEALALQTIEPERDEELIRERLAVFRAYIETNLGRGSFTQIPDEVRQDPALSRAAKAVYEHLLSYMWQEDIYCWPSQKRMAQELGRGCSVRTIIRALNELYERGFIEKLRRGLCRTNYYFINPLHFVLSFKRPGRGRGKDCLLQVNAPERQTAVDSLPPYDALSGKCQNDTSENANLAYQETSFWQTIYTKGIEKVNDANSGISRSGTAAELVKKDGAAMAIRNTFNTKNDAKGVNTASTETKSRESKSNPRPTPQKETTPEWAKDVNKEKKQCRRKHERGEVPRPLPMYLAEHLASISRRFCDEATKSSTTSIAWCFADVAERGMSEYDFLDFLITARNVTVANSHTITRTTKDGAIAQMPYFLSVLERNVVKWCDEYDEQQKSAQLQATGAEPATSEVSERGAEAPTPPAGETASGGTPTFSSPEIPARDTQRKILTWQEVVAAAPIVPLATNDPTDGWPEKSAIHWAEKLQEHFGSLYFAQVIPTLCPDHYGVRLVERGTRKEYHYLNYADVNSTLNPRQAQLSRRDHLARE